MQSRSKEIRTAIVSALASVSAVNGRVYSSEVYPLNDLPAINVTMPTELPIEPSRSYDRTVKIEYTGNITISVKSTNLSDDTLDDLLVEVSEIIDNLSITGICVKWEGTERTYSGELEQPLAIGLLIYKFT